MADYTDSTATESKEAPDIPPTATGLSHEEFTKYLMEIQDQPLWRTKADREMDFVDGNQLDSDVLRKQAQIGMPPAVENNMGPAIDAVLGFEAKTRSDWRLSPDNAEDPSAEAVAKALNYKLNQAERQSGADRACSDAFRPQLCVGLGWVEVSRETDPFKFPYRCKAVHRNEIWWDMLAKEPDLSDARFLVRRRWTDADQVKLKFPKYARLVNACMDRWGEQWLTSDGGASTNLHSAWGEQRGWTIEEQEWIDTGRKRACLFECWYRRWEEVTVIRLLDGRVVEYDKNNPMHTVAIAVNAAKPARAVVARMYVSFWMGPHKLYDGKSPYKHNDFPYVAFWGKREDRTGVPYGAARSMMYLQENINSVLSKLRWGLSSVRVTRTKGVYPGTDAQLRNMVARVDADIVLDADAMSKPGARFDVERDFQMNDQQFTMLQTSRDGIVLSSGITPSFKGGTGTARSGVQESTQIEQTTQALADLMDNFRFGRTKVGELLVSLLIEDLSGKPQRVVVKGNAVVPDVAIDLNTPVWDETLGMQRLDNDVQRIRLKVALNDVPTTPSFRSQQLQALTEAFKSMPQEIQVVALPHLLNLMDVPNKEEIIQAVRDNAGTLTPEQVQSKIDEAVARALKDAQYDLKARELDAKYNPTMMAAQVAKIHAEITSINADAGKKFMELMFAGMQAAEVVTAVPEVAPVADVLIEKAGGVPGNQPVPAGDPSAALAVEAVKNKRTGIGFVPGGGAGPQAGDTTPLTPQSPATPGVGANQGIDTMRADSTQT